MERAVYATVWEVSLKVVKHSTQWVREYTEGNNRGYGGAESAGDKYSPEIAGVNKVGLARRVD